VLDENRIDSQRSEFFPLIGLEKGAARVLEHFRLDQAYAGQVGLDAPQARSSCCMQQTVIRIADERAQRRWL
jgi:hypothetical protein